ncbi:MAG: hypothetical protein JKY51_11240 [Opitutaceae bacterium]|nr:hypothetical protein [Opitutaceae bacterium]
MKTPQAFRSQNKGGCLIQILITLGVVVLIGLCFLGGGFFWGYKKAVSFTSEESLPPLPTYTQAKLETQYTELKPRLDKFYKELEEGPDKKKVTSVPEKDSGIVEKPSSQTRNQERHSSSLSLSATDLNALFFHWKKKKSFDISATFHIEGHILSIDSGFPLNGIVGFKDRYFRGTLSLKESPDNYPLPLILHSVRTGGKTLPDMFLNFFKKPDAALAFIDQFDLSSAVSQVKSIQIYNNTLEIELYGSQQN